MHSAKLKFRAMGGFASVLAVLAGASQFGKGQESVSELRNLAHAYYEWQTREFPVTSSEQGLHTWDARLTGYSPGAIAQRRQHVHELLERVRAMKTDSWSKDDRIDQILFRAQLERPDFEARVLRSEESNPLLYMAECSNAIFSLLKKEYAPHRTRAIAATARLRAMPGMLEQAKKNLTQPVRLYSHLAIESARSIDSLFTKSLMTVADELTPEQERELEQSRETALKSIHSFADDLELRLGGMPSFQAMGAENYEYFLRHVYLLPIGATQLDMLGQAELARYRGLEALLRDPQMADPNPARIKTVPRNEEEFLSAYENRLNDILRFLKQQDLITIPDYVGPFSIRQLPAAFKPTFRVPSMGRI